MTNFISKFSLLVLLAGTASNVHANTFEINDDDKEVTKKCKHLEINRDVLSCKGAKDFKEVKKAKVGSRYIGPGLDAIGENDLDVIFDLGIMPDADTNKIYSFVRKLVDSKTNKQIGYITYEGFENSEMQVRLQVVKRFNLAAQLVSVKVETK